jgi:hypothetical protein
MLMHACASSQDLPVPFLVRIGAYASEALPGSSIAEYIEQDLPKTYECRLPGGLVERLLRGGAALVIFDGLDEVVDGPRRRDLARRIELFCEAYPSVRVLVTSRETGYDQARLDSSQFTCYRLAEFGRPEVEDYALRWFADTATAQAFLSDSEGTVDLRSNPLLLSLMCSPYQHEGPLPASRAGLYERCASLLLRQWDEERCVPRKLSSRVEVRPLVRYLAWWLLTAGQPVIREGRLLAEAAAFLQARGFGTADEAEDAAMEFVEFCRERTWVLSPGITAQGERGYGFTHRTFLEYYAAAHIATELHTTPGDLAGFLAGRVSDGEWNAADLLAVSVMEQKTDDTADHVFRFLLEPDSTSGDRGELLKFLVRLLDHASPSAAAVRALTRQIILHRIDYDPQREILHPLVYLTPPAPAWRDLVSSEISSYLSTAATSGDPRAAPEALRLLLELADHRGRDPSWHEWAAALASRHAADIAGACAASSELRTMALYANVITVEQALKMPGGLSALMQPVPQLLECTLTTPYPGDLYMTVTVHGVNDEEAFTVIGRYAISHPALPMTRASDYDFGLADSFDEEVLRSEGAHLSETAGLGLAVVHAICAEVFGWDGERPRADLPMPARFKQTFSDWAEGKADFAAKSADSEAPFPGS